MENERMVTIYHRVMRRENFEVAAKDIFNLVKNSQKIQPNKLRKLYLDIDGHRTNNGAFDEDMYELMSNFLLGFMSKYLTEITCPLYSIVNSNKQINDIPESLCIRNKKNHRDDALDKLYIENYSNTELMSEEDVYKYLKKFSKFLFKFKELRIIELSSKRDNDYLINCWFNYAKDLIIELHNTLIYGNLLSVTAMTRTLIECYAYLTIFVKEEDTALLEEWYFCSVINNLRNLNDEHKDKVKSTLKNWCETSNKNYEILEKKYSLGNENKWLESKINKKHITFKDICEYTNISNLYDDFKEASSFIHVQDITSKIMPFTFYDSIMMKIYKTIFYIFRIIELFPNNKSIIKESKKLEKELDDLVNTYL